MKVTIAITSLLCINTSALIAEPFINLLEQNFWYLIILEIVLAGSLYLNRVINDLNKKTAPDFSDIDLYVFSKKGKFLKL